MGEARCTPGTRSGTSAYADERGRPFVDLVARIGADRAAHASSTSAAAPATSPRCSSSAGRTPPWSGVDSSPEMIARGRAVRATGSSSRSATCGPGGRHAPVDVLVSNATLQWVPGHLDLLPAPGRARSPRAAGSPSRCPATSTSRATRSGASWRGDPRVRGVHRRRGHARRLRSRGLPRRAGRPRLRGRRVGDDVPARADRRGPGLRLGVRHRGPADPPGAARRRCGRSSRPSSSAGCARPTRAGRHGTVLPFRRVFVVAQVPG